MATKRVEYIGSLRPGVIIPQVEGGFQEVSFGEAIEVDADLAKGLLSQSDNWREPKPGPKPRASEGDES